jgi:hypothetical protein
MKIKIQGLIVLISAAILVGCGSHGDSHEHGSDTRGIQEASYTADDAHGLVLNGSKKWEMDEHTRGMFTKMDQRLKSTDLGSSSADDLKASGVILRKDIDDLIAGCTMVGDAHNELHKYLTVYIPVVDELVQKGDSSKAEEVHELLELYPKFFE